MVTSGTIGRESGVRPTIAPADAVLYEGSDLKHRFRLAQELAAARAGPAVIVASPDKGAAAEEAASQDGVRRTLLSLLMSVSNIGLVTVALLVLNQHLAASLVPIAYLPE